jgi:hypothetical protein
MKYAFCVSPKFDGLCRMAVPTRVKRMDNVTKQNNILYFSDIAG